MMLRENTLSAINQGNYYIRFFDISGNLIAIAGNHPEGLPLVLNQENWQTLQDSKGNFYHQISITLHTRDHRDWGYFQVGRSLKDFNDYLNNVKWILKLGLPTTLILVAISSWWLAGLAMQPIYQSYQQIQQFTALAFSKSVNLTAAIQVNNPLNVMGNEEQLYRLFSNLIINAIQYTPAEGEVTVILDSSDNQALIQIQDTGIGIPPAEQKRIFDRFYRINSDRSRHTGGSGLGLAIAKAIVQSHKGSIQVQSELNKGSTFIIRLPLEVTPKSQIKQSFNLK